MNQKVNIYDYSHGSVADQLWNNVEESLQRINKNRLSPKLHGRLFGSIEVECKSIFEHVVSHSISSFSADIVYYKKI